MRLWRWVQRNSLWLVGLGLMLASSGLDGVYMGAWMPWVILGLVLNTMSDVASMTLTYWFGRLQQGGKVKRRLSLVLLPAELVAVAFSWFFSWRQLRKVLPAVEPEHWRWVAPIAAAFIPLLLASIGYTQSLLAGKLDEKRTPTGQQVDKAAAKLDSGYTCSLCRRSFGSQAALNGHQRAHSNNGHKVKVNA